MAKAIVPELTTAHQVNAICEKMQTVERERAKDRAWIDALANGKRPYTPDEVLKHQIQINVNWGGLRKIIQTANSQINNALIFKEHLFTATCVKGDPEKREIWSEYFTKNINALLRRKKLGKRHTHLLKSRNASITLHGIGPIMWMRDDDLLGRFIPLEDLLIPTDTLVDFSNLGHFAVNINMTQSELFNLTHGEKVDKRWNTKAVETVLDDIAKPLENVETFTFADNPEKRVEQFKQNRCYYESDAATTVKLRFFFFKDYQTGKWYRHVLLKEGTPNQPTNKDFLYDGNEHPFANDLSEILHIQFGDNNLCAPLKYHSVRGLGAILYSAEECNNRILCETVQHTLLNLKTFMRIQNPTDRDRPKILDLSQYSVIEEGISIIPQQERHQIDPRLIEYVQSQLRQIMSEGSTSYVQDIQKTSSQPETATKTNALVQTANIQVSAMLQSLYDQETSYYEEMLRRALNKNSTSKEVLEFQKQCIEDGIPSAWMTPDYWTVTIDRVLGGGDQFLATQEANALLSQSQRFDPNAQRTILRKWTTTTTRNPAMGEMLVPIDQTKATPGVVAAEDVFGTLMQGIPTSIREGIDRSNYIESMIGMLKSKVEMIAALDNVGTPQDLIGLKTVVDHIAKNIQIMAMDLNQKSQVKIYGDMLGQLVNIIKAFEQRQSEAAQARSQQSGVDPKVMAAVQAEIMKAQAKSNIMEASAEQKRRHREIQFQLNEARKNAETMANLDREQFQAKQQMLHQNLSKALEAFNTMHPPESNTTGME